MTVPVGIERAWDALWNEARWPELTDLVEAVDIIDGGDRHGNGRLRRIHQHRRWWDPTLMMERTERVASIDRSMPWFTTTVPMFVMAGGWTSIR